VQKKTLAISMFLVFLVLISGVFFLYKRNQKKLESLDAAETTNRYGNFVFSDKLPNVSLTCKLYGNEVTSSPEQLGPELVVLRMAPCVYQTDDGEDRTVNVPLVYYNSKLNQTYSLNVEVTDLGKPGDGYIDNMLKNTVFSQGDSPIVSLEADSDYSREDPKLIKFAARTRQTLMKDWAKLYARTSDVKFLPKTSSGKRVFVALNFSFKSLK